MMDRTDRHCRFFHRLLAPRALLYTEMVATGALLHAEPGRWLDHDAAEHPLALQLGGSDPDEVARCATLAQRWAFDELNLNCGCPSPRVQRGAFGAALMYEPHRVAACVRAMRTACDLPVTVKCRIGVDERHGYDFLRMFVDEVAAAGCRTFIVHARQAWLAGLSPKENREIPPLRYERVHRLKAERPMLEIVLNGGLREPAIVRSELGRLDGVMIGREAYQNPTSLPRFEAALFGTACAADLEATIAAMEAYAGRQVARGVPLAAITRHMLGLCNGLPGARAYRRVLSEDVRQPGATPDLIRKSFAEVGGLAKAA